MSYRVKKIHHFHHSYKSDRNRGRGRIEGTEAAQAGVSPAPDGKAYLSSGAGRHGAHGPSGIGGAPWAMAPATIRANGGPGRPHGTSGERFLAVLGLSGPIRSHKTPKNAPRRLNSAAAITSALGCLDSRVRLRKTRLDHYFYCNFRTPDASGTRPGTQKEGPEPMLFWNLLKSYTL